MAKGTRAARKEARPREILEAAFEEFSTRGYAATSVESIAERVGVTKGTIYVYFSNKEDVFEKMVAEMAQPSVDIPSFLESLRSTAAIDVLIGLVRKLYEVTVEDYYTREIFRFLIAESHSFGASRRIFRETFALPVLSAIEAIIHYGCESGQFRKEAADLDPVVLISPLLGLNVLRHVDPETDVASSRFIEQHLGIIEYILLDLPQPSLHLDV